MCYWLIIHRDSCGDIETYSAQNRSWGISVHDHITDLWTIYVWTMGRTCSHRQVQQLAWLLTELDLLSQHVVQWSFLPNGSYHQCGYMELLQLIYNIKTQSAGATLQVKQHLRRAWMGDVSSRDSSVWWRSPIHAHQRCHLPRWVAPALCESLQRCLAAQ